MWILALVVGTFAVVFGLVVFVAGAVMNVLPEQPIEYRDRAK